MIILTLNFFMNFSFPFQMTSTVPAGPYVIYGYWHNEVFRLGYGFITRKLPPCGQTARLSGNCCSETRGLAAKCWIAWRRFTSPPPNRYYGKGIAWGAPPGGEGGPRRVEELEGRDVAHFSFQNDQLHTTITLRGSQPDMCSAYARGRGNQST